MTADNLLERAACGWHATIQSLALIGDYPLLQAWLTDMVIQSYPEDSFAAHSRLTSKGLPLEYAVVWPSHNVRCTADVLPGGTPQQRITKTLHMAGKFTNAFQQDIIAGFLRNPDKTSLRYGAWIGVREAQHKISTKVYMEIAGNHNPGFFNALGICGTYLQSFGVQAVMAGLPVSNGEVEVYFKLARLDRSFLSWLLGYFNFPDRTQDIFKMLEQLCDSGLHGSVNWSSIGFSVTWSAGREVQSVTVYSFASSAIGSDKMVGEHVLRLGRKNNWDMDLYQKLSAKATGITDLNTFHGMVGVVAGTTGNVHFTVGISPVSNTLS